MDLRNSDLSWASEQEQEQGLGLGLILGNLGLQSGINDYDKMVALQVHVTPRRTKRRKEKGGPEFNKMGNSSDRSSNPEGRLYGCGAQARALYQLVSRLYNTIQCDSTLSYYTKLIVVLYHKVGRFSMK